MIKGIYIFNDVGPPYGYYHIRKVYEDGSFWDVCYLDMKLDHKIKEIAQMIAESYDVDVIDSRDIAGKWLNDF